MADTCPNNKEADGAPPAKKIKIEVENESTEDIHFSNFQVTRVLQNNSLRKQICVQGIFKGHDEPAVIVLEKKAFPIEKHNLENAFFSEAATLRKLFTNDIYGNYVCYPSTENNGLNVTVIHPATPKHIEKFNRRSLHIVDETQEIYEQITLPYIQSSSFSLDWIQNILDGKAEQENVIYTDKDKDAGFVIVKDLKWDEELETLKLIALPFKNIRSIRELDASHLPLLKNIKNNGAAAISKKYNIPVSQLRMYFHYQPSYYYLHVHIAYLMFEAPGIRVEKAHLLSTVIRNLELMSDYYKKAVLPCTVAEGNPLYLKFKEQELIHDKGDCTDT